MFQAQGGSIRLFRLAGIDVLLHWSWLVVAFVEIHLRRDHYHSQWWNVAEYLALFGIVLLHEFGHALACRQVGGIANRIILWPLGGIAYVRPPPRPGAFLWSIAAGPLVNVLLVPLTIGLAWCFLAGDLLQPNSDLSRFFVSLALMNALLLVLNLLPIYPLDGGQILQALLWFLIGRAPSLMVASGVGLVGALGLLGWTLLEDRWGGRFWLMVIAGYIALRSLLGIRQARLLWQVQQLPRHEDLACPSCGAAPLKGSFWRCDQCRTAFDTFEEDAVCPWCGTRFPDTSCPECYQRSPIEEWAQVGLSRQPWPE